MTRLYWSFLLAATAALAQTPPFFTDNFPGSTLANYFGNGALSQSASGRTTGGSGSLIYRHAIPDGTPEYEARVTYKFSQNGGSYITYLRATTDSQLFTNTGTFYAAEVLNPQFSGGGCSATLIRRPGYKCQTERVDISLRIGITRSHRVSPVSESTLLLQATEFPGCSSSRRIALPSGGLIRAIYRNASLLWFRLWVQGPLLPYDLAEELWQQPPADTSLLRGRSSAKGWIPMPVIDNIRPDWNMQIEWDLRSGGAAPEDEVIVTSTSYDAWRPEAGAGGGRDNDIAFKAVLQKKGGGAPSQKAVRFQWKFTNISREPGYTMNVPIANAGRDTDLRFEAGPTLLVPDEEGQRAETPAGLMTESDAVIALRLGWIWSIRGDGGARRRQADQRCSLRLA